MAEGGLILVEGPVLDRSDRVFADFYCRNWFADDPTNRWVPTIPCLREWPDCTFFDVVSEISFERDLSQSPAVRQSGSTATLTSNVRKLLRPGGVQAARRKLQKWVGWQQDRATHAASDALDRYIVVAWATSASERLGRHVNAKAMAPLVTGPGMTSEAGAGYCEGTTHFHRAQPWHRMRHDVTIKVECASLGTQPAFVMVLGNGSIHRGITVYFDRGWLTMTPQGSLPGSRIVWASFLAVLYRGEAELPAGEPDTLRDQGWTIPRETYPFAVINEAHDAKTLELGSQMRRPDARELQLLEAGLRALPAFIEKQRTTEVVVEELTAPVAEARSA